MSYFIGFVLGFLAAVVLDVWADGYAFRKISREIDLRKSLENAYNYGYEVGRLETEMKYAERLNKLTELCGTLKGKKGENK